MADRRISDLTETTTLTGEALTEVSVPVTGGFASRKVLLSTVSSFVIAAGLASITTAIENANDAAEAAQDVVDKQAANIQIVSDGVTVVQQAVVQAGADRDASAQNAAAAQAARDAALAFAFAAAATGKFYTQAGALADNTLAVGASFIEVGTGKVFLKTSTTVATFADFIFASQALVDTLARLVPGPDGEYYFMDATGNFQTAIVLQSPAYPYGMIGPMAEAMSSVIAQIGPAVAAAALIQPAVGDGSVYVQDTTGNVGYRMGPDGFEYPGGLLTLAAGPTDARLRTPFRLSANINHVIAQGQSNGYGTATKVATIPGPASNALMFYGGIRPTDGADSTAYTSMVPAGERVRAGTETAETFMSSLAINLDRFLLADGFNIQTSDVRLFLSTAATPSVDAQYRGTPERLAYANNQIQQAYNLAQAAGLSYQLLAIPVATGENASQQRDSAAVFQAAELYVLDQMRDYYRSLVNDPTAQPLYLFSQVASCQYWAAGYWDIAFAQVDMCERIDHCILVAPDYISSFNTSDNLHEDAPSKDRLGAYYAQALDMALKGVKFRPTAALEYTRQGNICTIRYRVPTLPLQFVTSLVSDPGNYGFVIHAADGTVVTINSVAVVKDGVGDTVKIVCATPIPVGSTVEYAMNGSNTQTGRLVGPRGCLCDSSILVGDQAGTAIPLQNYAVISRKVLL